MGQARTKSVSAAATAASRPPAVALPQAKGILATVREWADALVIAFLLAMFIRTFVVELFKIPSGSMTPTLVGTGYDALGRPDEYCVEWDVSTPPDGEKDLILDRGRGRSPRYHVFYREKGKYVRNVETDDLYLPPEAAARERVRNDRIIVNKFLYWFRPPRRGEIIVFRVPPSIYQRDKPIYIKRLAGLPGELLEIRHPHVYINGEELTQPEIFATNEYVNRVGDLRSGEADEHPSYIKWHAVRNFVLWYYFDSAQVPPRGYFMLGDNSKSSKDSRDWGAVPEDNIKGKAIFRYWPLRQLGFLP